MYQNPALIKRPVLVYGKKFFVGFSETDYKKIFNPD